MTRYIARPVQAVLEAVVDPARLSRHFATGGARGRPEPGGVVTWAFHDDPGDIPVDVLQAVPDTRLALRWTSEDGSRTTFTIAFQVQATGTRNSVSEQGWPMTAAGLATSNGNCEGWAAMLAGLKAWLEHDLVLRSDPAP